MGYDTAGDSDLELGASASVGATHYDTTQRIVQLDGMNVTIPALVRYCSAHTCSKQRQALLDRLQNDGALKAQSNAFDQVSLGASASATLWRDTDVGLGGMYCLYAEDPTQVGYFSLASTGKVGAPVGTGVPLAPPQWSLRPDLAHRFGDLQVALWYQHTQYVPGEGRGELVGLKVQYRFSKAFRLWLTAAAQRDRDAEGSIVQTGAASLGAKVRW